MQLENIAQNLYQTIKADYSEQDRPNITNAPETIEYTYSPYKVNYKSVISKYTMPFNYLWAFLVCGRDQQFISDFADLVLNSSIEISIYDNLVEIQDETIEAYNNNYMESTRTWKRTLVNGSVSGEETMGDWTEPEVKSTTHNFDINYTKTYNNTIVIAATNIDIWYMKYAANYTYEVIDDGETKEITRLEPDPIASPSELITAGNVQFGEWKTTSTKTEPEWGTGAANIPVITGYKVTKNQEKVDKVFQNRKNQNTMTTFYHQIQYKYTLDGVPEVKEKTDPTLQEGDEGYPNFCTLYLKSKDERRNIDGVESWLFTIIESNADTVDMLELTKYLLYRATNKNFGVTELDFQSLYAPSDGFYDFSSIGDLDVSDESLFITDLEKLKEAFTGYSRSDKLVQYAQEFLDMQSKYKVNALFAAAVSITETGAGNAGNATKTANAQNSVGATAGQCWNNWFNVKTGSTPYGIVHNGEGESHYRIYAEVGDSINGFGDLIANGSYYYTQGRYTVNAIGHTYCPNSEAYPTQGDDWVKTTLQLINNFYSKVGMSVGAPTGGSSDEKLAYLFPDGIPTDQAGCSKYIQTITVALTTKDGTKTTGSLSIHKSLTADVQRVFQEAQDKGFKIYSAGGYSFRKMNNGGSGSLSHHSYGVAIDINVNENYSHRGSTVYAGSFWNPAKSEFSIPRDGVLVRAFAAIGWSWGGNWSGNYQDYMHFSYTGH